MFNRYEGEYAVFSIREGLSSSSERDVKNQSPPFRYSNLPKNLDLAHILMFDAMTIHLPTKYTPGNAFSEEIPSASTHDSALVELASPRQDATQFNSTILSSALIESLNLDLLWLSDKGDLEFVAILEETVEIHIGYEIKGGKTEKGEDCEVKSRKKEFKEVTHTIVVDTDSRDFSQRIQSFAFNKSE